MPVLSTAMSTACMLYAACGLASVSSMVLCLSWAKSCRRRRQPSRAGVVVMSCLISPITWLAGGAVAVAAVLVLVCSVERYGTVYMAMSSGSRH